MTRNLNILGTVALLLLGGIVIGVVGMKWLEPVEQVPAPLPAQVDAEPESGVETVADVGEGEEVAAEVEQPARYPPGTIWLDAPAEMVAGEVYAVPVMVELGEDDLRSVELVLEGSLPYAFVEAMESYPGDQLGFSYFGERDAAGKCSVLIKFEVPPYLGSGTVRIGALRMRARMNSGTGESSQQRFEARRTSILVPYDRWGSGHLPSSFIPCTIRIVEPGEQPGAGNGR